MIVVTEGLCLFLNHGAKVLQLDEVNGGSRFTTYIC